MNRHVRFNEKKFPFASLLAHGSLKSSSTLQAWFDPAETEVLPSGLLFPFFLPGRTPKQQTSIFSDPQNTQPIAYIHASPHHQKQTLSYTDSYHSPSPACDDKNVPSSVPHINTTPTNTSPSQQNQTDNRVHHHMVTCRRDGTRKLKVPYTGMATRHLLPTCLQAVLSDEHAEPSSYSEAIKIPHRKAAMHDEFNALIKQQAWFLLPASQANNIVGCKWVFKVKRKADGTIERYKARLVAKGYNQQHGIDFDQTFYPVVKPTTIRLVLSMAVNRDWSIRQLDVKNAFLHGVLNEVVYMKQPPGFHDKNYPDHVCHIHKSIYVLRQASRTWFDGFSTTLFELGFVRSRSDTSMFIHPSSGAQTVLLLYVDDIIITCSNNDFISSIIARLHSRFEVKDLGELNYFLGIEVRRDFRGLQLSQTKYALALLKRANFLRAKPCASPATTRFQVISKVSKTKLLIYIEIEKG